MDARAQSWLDRYRSQFSVYVEAASRSEAIFLDALRGRALDIHVVGARAKDPDSAAEKIERRAYSNPARSFDDLIGVRIITLYEHSVPLVSERIRDRFEVDEKRSANKSARLKSREVGYRSDHLVLKLERTGDPKPVSDIFKSTFVEVQIRSVVSHAWAEIEHSLRYKSGVQLPADLSRRFDALAGTLELVDREFSAIEGALVGMVESLSAAVTAKTQLGSELTPLSLLGTLVALRPDMVRLGPHKLALPIEDAFRLAKILNSAGIILVSDLVREMNTSRLRRTLLNYAELRGDIDTADVSATVVVGGIVACIDRAAFDSTGVFQADPSLIEAVQ